MTKRLFGALLVAVTTLVAPLHADLKYTMRIEARKSEAPAPATPPNAIMGMISNAIVNTMAPGGGLDVVVTVSDRGTRVDYPQAYAIVPAGGSAIMRPDGSMTVIDPAKRTFWNMAKPDLAMLGPARPAVSIKRTGEFAEVAGMRAERAAMEITLPLPVPPGTQLPAGMPSELVMRGDAWITEQYRDYARITAGLMGGVSALGFTELAGEGFVVRTIMRGEMFGDREVESRVTSVAESTLPASTFDVPQGFVEVPPPSGMGGILGR